MSKKRNTIYNRLVFKLITDALVMGYKFDVKTGNVIGIMGSKLALINGGPKNEYRYFCFCPLGEKAGRVKSNKFIPVHQAMAFFKFGKKALRRNYRIKHINGIKSDNSAINLELVKIVRTVFDGKSKFECVQSKLSRSPLKSFLRKAAKKYKKSLTVKNIDKIQTELEDGVPYKHIAEYYEMSPTTIRKLDDGTLIRWNVSYFQ